MQEQSREQNIRNFSIIAHIDHGKSTLADRMLQVTNTIEVRKMRDQVLDSMELERERGITIKMQPVSMKYVHGGQEYLLNLIDTPGHIDFSYEVSRSLKAVEGAILLVDATQGVQAQTLTTLRLAQDSSLCIIPVMSKVDSPLARTDEIAFEIAELLGCDPDSIHKVSGKTGEGVPELLSKIIETVPPPVSTKENKNDVRALIFDFEYSNHQGVILYVRVLDGSLEKNGDYLFVRAKERFIAPEVGTFQPQKTAQKTIEKGQIGYIVTGVKQPGIARVGDTITLSKHPLEAFPGYAEPRPIVWASVYGETQDDFPSLRTALQRLKLSDSSLTFEEETSGSLGRGFRCGFLGMLHLEIITERLRREFDLDLIVTSPSIHYEITMKNGQKEVIYSPIYFPSQGNFLEVYEPWVEMQLITPTEYVSNIMQSFQAHEVVVGDSEVFGDRRLSMHVQMPLRELMRGFFDEIKSNSSGYASISYEIGQMKKADVTRLDIYVAEEIVPAFSRVVSVRRAQEEAEEAVEKLHKILPAELFKVKIQAYVDGRIIASRSIAAVKKDVTGYLYGGDITRKMKLREKQKRGKKRMLAEGKVHIEHDTFMSMMKKD
jgi:GTP-binding protein LepA